jgi:hypothetical protein
VRLAVLAALALAVLVPGIARAETVPGTLNASSAGLAVAADGTPRVAAIVGGRLVLATRTPDGTWASEQAPPLPTPQAIVVGVAVAGGGRVYALVEQTDGSWLALAERRPSGWRTHVLVRKLTKGGVLGVAGLAIDRAGRPVVGYVVGYPTRKTWLRLVRVDPHGRYATTPITSEGFPPSDSVPSAAPVVLPNGRVRVVETYSSAAIEWATKGPAGRVWQGQFLFSSPLGSPAGVVAAAAASPGVWSAWTELYPNFGESHVVLALHRDAEQSAVLAAHAFVVALVGTSAAAEVAADDYVDGSALGGSPQTFAYAGLILSSSGGTTELADKIVGYVADAAGGRQLLLEGASSLEWFRSPTLPSTHVTLTGSAVPGGVALAGRVTGGSGGSVAIFRERPDESAVLVATTPLGADGSFAAVDSAPPSPALYRAVYRAAPDGIPFGSLLRTPVAPG